MERRDYDRGEDFFRLNIAQSQDNLAKGSRGRGISLGVVGNPETVRSGAGGLKPPQGKGAHVLGIETGLKGYLISSMDAGAEDESAMTLARVSS
jgi:hypothetical protein